MSGGNPQQQNVSSSTISPEFNLQWTYSVDAGIGYNAISTADGILFVNTLQGEMYSLDIESGGKIGYLKFLGKEANSVPLIDRQNVILAFAGDKKTSLVSYNIYSSQINWETNIGYLQTSPVLYDEHIYIGSLNGYFYKFDLSGNQKWQVDSKSQIHSTCAIDKQKAVFGSDDGYLYCVNIGNGSVRWKFKSGASVFATPLIFNDYVFFGAYDSNYYCLTLNDGNLIWKHNLSTKIFTGSALYKDESVICGGINGCLYSLDLNEGSILWKYQTNGVITSTPIVCGANVYFSNLDYTTFSVDAKTGLLRWSFELDGRGKTTPVIWKNYLFIASDIDLYCFKSLKSDGKNN